MSTFRHRLSPSARLMAPQLVAARTPGRKWHEVAAEFGLNPNTVRKIASEYLRAREDDLPAGAPVAPSPAHRVAIEPVHFRAAVVDIETTDFNAVGYQGYLLCVCILPLDGEDVETIQAEHGEPNDRQVLEYAVKRLSQFDLLIGHNITAFDLNWLNSRRMVHGMPPLRTWFVYDTYQALRSLALASRKSLAFAGDFFGLAGEKTAVRPREWNNVRSPYGEEYTAAMRDIVYHCEQDVRLNRELFWRIYRDTLTLRESPIKMTKWRTGSDY